MKQTNKDSVDRRESERRIAGERRSETMRAATGDRRVVENRGVGEAMVDALQDILQWERASEKAIRIAAQVAAEDVPADAVHAR